MTHPQCIDRRRGSAFALPRVQSNVMMVTASGDEPHAKRLRHAHHIKPDHAMIEIHGLVDVANVQMDMSHACFWRDGYIETVIFAQMREQRVYVQRLAPVTQGAVRAAR